MKARTEGIAPIKNEFLTSAFIFDTYGLLKVANTVVNGLSIIYTKPEGDWP